MTNHEQFNEKMVELAKEHKVGLDTIIQMKPTTFLSKILSRTIGHLMPMEIKKSIVILDKK